MKHIIRYIESDSRRQVYAVHERDKPIILIFSGDGYVLDVTNEECAQHYVNGKVSIILSSLLGGDEDITLHNDGPIQWLDEGRFSVAAPGEPPLYLGLFVDDFIYFSASPTVEQKFEQEFSKSHKIDFQGEVSHFLGIKFTNVKHNDGNLDIYMNQPVDIQDLIRKADLHHDSSNSVKAPYRSGLPVDSVPDIEMSTTERAELNQLLQEYVGSLNWLANQTRPDLSTITNLIAQYNSKCSPGHIESAKHVIRYLKDTANLGIKFSSNAIDEIESFVQFPLDPDELTGITDANWGPQDQSVPKPEDPPEYLELFKSRSIAGYVVWLCGPIDWMSKRQSYTARSSAEAEIGAVDECTKTLQQIRNILQDLSLFKIYHNGPITIYNDNSAAVQWSHNMSTKGLRYIQMRENAVREQVANKFVQVEQIAGKRNPSDIFTKEDRDPSHYIECRNALCAKPPSSNLKPCPNSQRQPDDTSSISMLHASKGGVNGHITATSAWRS